MADVVKFPENKAPEFMIGPFEEYRVVLEGKLIPKLTARHEGDEIALILDHRLSISVPAARAYDIAWFVAESMAIGAGYPCFAADKKNEAFAVNCTQLEIVPEQ